MKTIPLIIVVIAVSCHDGGGRTKEQIRVDIIKQQFNVRNGSHIQLTDFIKDNMNDPDSYEHIETKFTDKYDYIIVSTRFREANVFGAKVINEIHAHIDLRGNILDTRDFYWERNISRDELRYLAPLDSSWKN